MTRERHLLRHYIFQTNEGDVVVASKQKNGLSPDIKCDKTGKEITTLNFFKASDA
jgi:hypothetical protein